MTKPTILIFVSNPNKELLKEIGAGIEEEGVAYEMVVMEGKDIDTLTFESSNTSILGTGIGVCHSVIALSLSSLEKGTFVFRIEAPTLSQARAIGTNAARIVKRKPLKEIKIEVLKP